MDYRREYLRLHPAVHDRVTGLPAYPVVIDRLRALLDRRRSLGVLHVAVRHLDTVESLYGWQAYDRVVEVAAEALGERAAGLLPGETVRAIDRVGGCAFLAFVADDREDGEWENDRLREAALELRTAVERALAERGLDRLNPAPEVGAGHARLSLNPFYRFERRLANAVAEAASLDARLERRREASWSVALEAVLREASVETLFQPVVELRSRAVLGWEALSRGPRDSALESPRAMFAVSERIGRAGDLDRICREAALRASAEVAGRGKIFVNALAGTDDAGDGPPDGRLLRELEAAALTPEDLVLEFSERGAERDAGRFVDLIRQVSDRGYAVALDDIGTGNVGRDLLETLRPQFLKLDVSLVRDVHENLIKQELLATIVDLARSIDAEVIAEGVESREEVDTLVDAGARFGQGYLFAEPAPPATAFGTGQPVAVDH